MNTTSKQASKQAKEPRPDGASAEKSMRKTYLQQMQEDLRADAVPRWTNAGPFVPERREGEPHPYTRKGEGGSREGGREGKRGGRRN